MTPKYACNILQVPLHLLFLSVLRSVLNFPFPFPPTAFLCYSSPFSPSLNSTASSVSFQSHFLVIRFFFDAPPFYYSYSSALLPSSRFGRLSLWWFFDLFSPEGSTIKHLKTKINLYRIEWFSSHFTENRSFLLENEKHKKFINKFCEQNAGV